MVNGQNSLHFANVMDNSGLKSGAVDAVGIVQGLAGQLAKINPFAALAAGAITAFTIITKGAYDMMSGFENAMREVQTISAAAQEDFKGISKGVFALSEITPDGPEKLAKAYYQIVSAGYDGAAGMKLLEVAAKAAVAGVTDTETAADGITTVLNAFKLGAEETEVVADALFNTVKLGKTTFSELSSNLSTVAPIAAASNIPLKEILASVASLTKQGVPTAQAMTQIRAGIVGLQDAGGLDGTKTFQENLQNLYNTFDGNQSLIKKEVGSIEAVQAILAVSGRNAEEANRDLEAYNNTVGATEEAFKRMASSNVNQWAILRNRIKAATEEIGTQTVELSSNLARIFNRALESSVDLKDAVAKQAAQYQILKGTLDGVNTPFERKLEILTELKKTYPDYLGSLDLDKIKNENLDEVLQEVKQSLEDINELYKKRIQLTGIQNKIEESRKAKDEYDSLLNADLSLFYDRVNDAVEFAEKNNIQLNVNLSDTPAKIYQDIRKGLITKENDGLLDELFGDANKIVQDLAKARDGVQFYKTALNDTNNELDRRIEKEKKQKVQLLDNERGYKEVVAQINAIKDLGGLEEFKVYKFDGIVQAVEARLEVIKILDSIKEIATKDGLSDYLASDNAEVAAAANKRLGALSSGGGGAKGDPEAKDKFKEFLKAKGEEYKSYEQYVTQIGQEEADKRYSQLLKSGADYAAFLKSQFSIAKNFEQEKTVLAAAAEANVSFREKEKKVEVTIKPIVEEIDIDPALKSINSLGAEKAKLEKAFNETTSQAQRDALAVKIKGVEEELEVARGGSAEEIRLYETVTNSLGSLTEKQLNDYIKYWKDRLKEAEGNADLEAEIMGKIQGAQNQKWKNTVDIVKGGIDELANIFSDFGDSLTADLLKGLSQAASQLDNVFTAFSENATTKDLVGGAVSGVLQLTSIVVGSAKRRKEAEEAYYQSVIEYQREYNLLLNEQLLTRDGINDNVFTTDYITKLQAGLSALASANNSFQDALSSLSEGRAKLGQRNAIDATSVLGGLGAGAGGGAAIGALVGTAAGPAGAIVGAAIGAVVGGLVGLFGGKKKKDKFGDLLTEYPELVIKAANGQETFNAELAQTLIDQNLVNKNTKNLLEDTIKWNEQLEKAREQIAGVVAELAGGLGDNLRDTLVTAFESGGDAAEAMGKTVSEVLQNILEQLIFDQIFSEQFKKLQDEMANSFDIGGDNNWIDDFSRFFEGSKQLTEQFNQALLDAQAAGGDFGFDLFNGGGQANGLAGAISSITEDTANILAGTLNGIRLDVARGLIVAEANTLYLSAIAQNTSYNFHLESIALKMGNIETSLNQFESKGFGG